MLAYTGYLTEQKLGKILAVIFNNVISQHRIKVNNKTLVVDFYIPEANTIVEFDGYYHYQSSKTIHRDIALDSWAKANNIAVIHHPYWLQLDERVFHYHFNKSINISTEYGHGFIDSKALLPADFNSLGWNRFVKQYKSLAEADCFSVMKEVYRSLELKIKQSGSRNLVIPVELVNLDIFHDYPT